ncbi:MAG: hypothetical protein GY710_21870 [Desulfobacteraceae bacterium]|nr:hypothetical protein [Desulfobacteraceae bacterium]
MDINQDINYQKHNVDLSQLNLSKLPPESKTVVPQGADSEISTDTASGASTVSLSEKGRAASVTFDFNATPENLLKLEALGNSKSFGKAHASISYDNVKNLLD